MRKIMDLLARGSRPTFVWIGIAFLALGTWARVHWLDAPFGAFDEGILLSDTHALFAGAVPYRDFYSNYAPGIFLLIGAVWKICGVSGLAIRLLALLFQLGLSLLAGRLAARMSTGRISWFTCGIVSVWTTLLGPALSAWLVGLVLLLASLNTLLWAMDAEDRKRFVLAGVLFGLLGCFRHDLFVYFMISFVLSWILPSRLHEVARLSAPPRRMFPFLLIGTSIPLAVVWLPCLYLAGFKRVSDDLFFTQVRYVMPGRVLPLPNLIAITHRKLPAFLSRPFEAGVALSFAGPFLALSLLCLRRVLKSIRSDMALPWMVCLSVAVIPQMLGRTDPIHAAYAVTPALILAAVLLEAARDSTRVELVRIALAAIPASFFALAVVISSPIWPPAAALPLYVGGSPYVLATPRPGFHESGSVVARQAVFDFLERHTSPNDAVFFGTDRHDRVFTNEADLYFLSNRPAGTRYIQFDPNVVTRREVQMEMISSLKQRNVRVVVLSRAVDPTLFENQPGLLPGSTLFDDYLHSHFAFAKEYPPYVVYTRRD